MQATYLQVAIICARSQVTRAEPDITVVTAAGDLTKAASADYGTSGVRVNADGPG